MQPYLKEAEASMSKKCHLDELIEQHNATNGVYLKILQKNINSENYMGMLNRHLLEHAIKRGVATQFNPDTIEME